MDESFGVAKEVKTYQGTVIKSKDGSIDCISGQRYKTDQDETYFVMCILGTGLDCKVLIWFDIANTMLWFDIHDAFITFQLGKHPIN